MGELGVQDAGAVLRTGSNHRKMPTVAFTILALKYSRISIL